MKEKIEKRTYKGLTHLLSMIDFNMPMRGVKEFSKGQKKLELILEHLKPYMDSLNKKRSFILLDNALEKDGILPTNPDGSYQYNKATAKKRDEELSLLMDSEFDFKLIPINNPEGLEKYNFLKDWTYGMIFDDSVSL